MSPKIEELRRRAEKLIAEAPENELAAAPDSVQKLVHELRVHQVELEIQNEELRAAEAAANESRKRYFELYDLAPVAYMTLDRRGIIRQANLTACELLGVSRDRIRLEKWRLAYHLSESQDLRLLDDSIGGAVSNHRRRTCELKLEISRTGGGAIYVHADFLPIEFEKESLVLVTLTDISGRKKAELALQKATEELEDRVRERTAELQRALGELEAKNKQLQEFTFAASHDLQEPLRKVQVFGNLLSGGCGERLDAKERDYLNRMQGAADRAQQMIKGLLSYSRVTTQAAPFERVDLNEILRQVIADLTVEIEKSGTAITVDELPPIKADPLQMVSLFQNLVSNAIKYRDFSSPPPRDCDSRPIV